MVTQTMPSRAKRLPSYQGVAPDPILKGTARNPDHHRLPGRPEVGGPDVEVQAVLTGDGKLWDEHADLPGDMTAGVASGHS